MSEPSGQPEYSAPAPAERRSPARYLGGCWFAIVGYFAGGMIAVGVAKLVGNIRNCTPVAGFPACDFEPYFRVGTLVGALLLPGLYIWRLWRNDAARRNSTRG